MVEHQQRGTDTSVDHTDINTDVVYPSEMSTPIGVADGEPTDANNHTLKDGVTIANIR